MAYLVLEGCPMKRLALLLPLICAAACSSQDRGTTEANSSVDELNADPDMFADKAIVSLRIEAPLTTAFRAAHAGEPNGPLPGLPRRVTDDFPGKMIFTTPAGEVKTLEATFKVRGNSSLSECPFPKLSMKLTDAGKLAAKNTMFAKQSKLKIGTHCADADDDQGGTIGRLRNEKSPPREAYVYQAFASVLPTTLATRVAKITYVDTANNNATVERNAMLLEHIEKLAKRSGAPDEHCRQVDGEEECDPVLTDSEVAAADPRTMDRARVAITTLFHAAVGNWDWRLNMSESASPTSGARLWNTEVILLPKPGGAPTDLVKLPIAHDFDLASAVTGRLRARETPTPAKLAVQAKEFLARTEGLTAEEVATAKQHFRDKKQSMYAALESAISLDDAARANAKAHLDAFFTELGP